MRSPAHFWLRGATALLLVAAGAAGCGGGSATTPATVPHEGLKVALDGRVSEMDPWRGGAISAPPGRQVDLRLRILNFTGEQAAGLRARLDLPTGVHVQPGSVFVEQETPDAPGEVVDKGRSIAAPSGLALTPIPADSTLTLRATVSGRSDNAIPLHVVARAEERGKTRARSALTIG